jgi:signal peptidase II
MRFVLALILLVGCVGCDQATKQLATEMLRGQPPQSYLANTVRLQYALNPGGFLSLGANLAPGVRFWLFTVLNVALLVGAVYMLLARWNMRLGPFIAVVFVLAGGLGNQIDRTLQGGMVTDFLNLGIGPLRTGIFNVADVALTVGALALVFTYRDTRTDAETTP